MRKFSLLLLGALFLCIQIIAQQRIITGKVTNADGLPVPNAIIVVKGLPGGTTTNAGGTFSVRFPDKAKSLLISAIGLSDIEVVVDAKGISMYRCSLPTKACRK